MQIIFLQERETCLNLNPHHPTQNQKWITSAPHQIETKNINIDLQGEQIDSKKTIEVLIKVIETYQTRMDDLLNVVEVLKNEKRRSERTVTKTKSKLNK